MEHLIDIIFKANLISIASYYLIYVLVNYFTHDKKKVITRHFYQELFFQFFNAYLTAIFSKGSFSICIVSGLTYALFQNLTSALLNVIIDRASIGTVIKFYHKTAFGSIYNKYVFVIYIVMVVLLSIAGYIAYWLIANIGRLW
jgi:hypothetical protein